MRIRALLLAIAVVGCRSTSEPCPVTQGPGCRWHAEYSDGKVVQVTTDIWYRTCPLEQPTPPARVIPDSSAVCEERR